MGKKNLSKIITCGHCFNIAPMNIIGSTVKYDSTDDFEYINYHGDIYSILECPACHKINIVSYFWHDGMESEDDVIYEKLYPMDEKSPLGLPENILSIYKSAEKIKVIDVDAYAILMRKMLELVCIDRKAKQGTLALMLEDLASKDEIPQKLVKIAKGLKDFGNIGAHTGSGKLGEEEIPILSALAKAILEYVYSAPYLASIAERQLEKIKK